MNPQSSKSEGLKGAYAHIYRYTESDGAERPYNGAGLIGSPGEEAQDMREMEKTGAVSSVYLVTALIFYRLL